MPGFMPALESTAPLSPVHCPAPGWETPGYLEVEPGDERDLSGEQYHRVFYWQSPF